MAADSRSGSIKSERLEALAHVADGGRAHLLVDHLRGVAALASEFGARFESADHSRLSGLWHDLGKYAGNFQKMIREANGLEAHIEGDVSGPRDHSTAGAIHARECLGPQSLAIAFAIAGHHAGLDDFENLEQRLKLKRERYDSALRGGALREILDERAGVIPAKFARKRHLLELWTRFVFSALCDADFLDTEKFFDAKRTDARAGWPAISDLRARLDAHLDKIEAHTPASEVNRVRREVLRACREAASSAPGAFSLTVPTGGGKTLAAMAFALAHAERHRLERVIVAIPFTSIIEQSAEAYRRGLGDGAVLEHHSAIEPERETARSRVAVENWDAPIVVTSNVQLFESLLANRPSACRKLHRIAKSVIVMDEAQALPPGMLAPTLDVLGALVRDFGASVVISTATQPAFGASPAFPEGLESVREIVPSELRVFERLRRVRVRWPVVEQRPADFEALADEISREADVLAIVHRRDDARRLSQAIDARTGDRSTLHLSALMCAEHRSRLLAEVKARKQNGEPIRLVSTQVVEAGVDLDFAVVYRAMGGLDALAQAAGRCNREGRREFGELRVFHAPTDPPRGVLSSGLAVANGMRAARPDLDLLEPTEHKTYFERLYNVQSRDAKGIQSHRASLKFKTVASLYRLIDDAWAAPIIVPYPGSASRIAELERFGPSRERLRGLQRYLVNVPRRLRDAWLAAGALRLVADTISVLDGAFARAYDSDRFGLVPEDVGIGDPSDFIV